MRDENDSPESSERQSPGAELPSSPLHPPHPETSTPQRRLRPKPPGDRPKTDFIIKSQVTDPTDEEIAADEMPTQSQRERAERALARLREKMAQVATEFATGKINRAQFNAIYSRYNEQRQITERLLERNPNSQAWRQVVKEGHTTFLRQHYQAHVLSYALYDNESSMPLYSLGNFKIETSLLVPMLSSFRAAASEMFGAGLKSTEIEGGRWLVFVPGRFTTSIVLFSVEPASRQLDLVQDLHRDFERANQQALARGVRDQETLVFPQRALVERKL
ncbi:MAG: hypothetical protein JXB47_20255 [Anaerolineae bacterium]|nr:hypothetical protein [Anaerolineae bacterium]